jgi:hypothetical protein
VKLGLSYTEKGTQWGMVEDRVLRKIFGQKKRAAKNKNCPSLNSYND